jgi:hypothetical protein
MTARRSRFGTLTKASTLQEGTLTPPPAPKKKPKDVIAYIRSVDVCFDKLQKDIKKWAARKYLIIPGSIPPKYQRVILPGDLAFMKEWDQLHGAWRKFKISYRDVSLENPPGWFLMNTDDIYGQTEEMELFVRNWRNIATDMGVDVSIVEDPKPKTSIFKSDAVKLLILSGGMGAFYYFGMPLVRKWTHGKELEKIRETENAYSLGGQDIHTIHKLDRDFVTSQRQPGRSAIPPSRLVKPKEVQEIRGMLGTHEPDSGESAEENSEQEYEE